MMIIKVQDRYVRNFNFGINNDKLLIINNSKNLEDHEESFKQDLLADDYLQYVVQLEHQAGEWRLVGGYAGEFITADRNAIEFAPDRALARSFLGRAEYAIDANRRLAFEGAVKRNGEGMWLKFEYSHAFGQHLRATASFTLIRGVPTDFLGQYERNSHGMLALRYSF